LPPSLIKIIKRVGFFLAGHSHGWLLGAVGDVLPGRPRRARGLVDLNDAQAIAAKPNCNQLVDGVNSL
jgi:hypothetical protein